MNLCDGVDFSPFFKSPEELAKKVLQVCFKESHPTYPINPFEILKMFNIPYQFRKFDNLEGIYIVPDDSNDLPLVGINIDRPITRQRFTAAHEICHHIKDRKSQICPLDGRKNTIEKFADKFAAELLMPSSEFFKISQLYVSKNHVDFDNIFANSDYFGVSFEASVYKLAYKFNLIKGDIEPATLKKRISQYKPENKRISLGIERHGLDLLRNILDCYEVFIQTDSQIVWNKFKIDFVYNENRLEGLEIDLDEISEIITDLRLNKQRSKFCASEYQTIIEVTGHSSIYDYISNTEEDISVWKLQKLNQLLYQYSPFPEVSGKFRDTNNLVIMSKFETSDYSQIIPRLIELDKTVQVLVNKSMGISITRFIDEVVKIHHEMTVIHPFSDGNGRVTRAFLNWLFILRKLPPVYIKYGHKDKYFDALSIADQTGNFDLFSEIFYKEVLRSMIQLNTKFN